MKIINQTSNNECGICAINMIINYYYHSDRDRKLEIYSYTKNMDKNGISMIEIENIFQKFNINAISYECKFSEIFSINSPFIMVMKYNDNLHYVVGKVKNNKLYIYDPIGKVKIYTKNDKLNEFLGYVICTSYKKQKIKPINLNLKIIKNVSITMNIIFTFINTFEFIFSLLISFILSKIVNINFEQTFEESIWKICFIYIVILLLSELFNYLNKIIKNYYFSKVFPASIDIFWQKINNKTSSFFQMYSIHELSQIYMYTYKIINFICIYTSDIFSDMIVLILSFILGIIINPLNLYFYLLLILINFFIMYLNIKLDKKLVNFAHKQNPIHDKKILNFFENKINNINYQTDTKISKEIQLELNNTLWKTIEIQNKISLLDCIDKIINSLIQFILIILIIKNENENDFSLFFLNLNIVNLYNKSLKSILNYLNEYSNINLILDIVKKIYSINENNNSKIIPFKKIDNIIIGNNNYSKNICINTKNILENPFINNLINLNEFDYSIKINGFDINKINKSLFIKKMLILITPKKYKNNNISTFLSNSVYEYCSQIDKDFNREINLLITLSNLINEENKLIILNDNLLDIDDDFFQKEIKKMLLEINKKNFLISNCNNKKIIDIYDNFI